jgi:hypothetical protein
MKNLFFVLIGSAALMSCGGGSTVSLPDGKGGTTKITSQGDSAKGEMTMTGADGKTVTVKTNSGDATFPAFAPQYPGSTVGQTSDMMSDGTHMVTIEQFTADAPDKVVAFYKAALEKNGVKIGMSGSNDGKSFLSAGSNNPKEDKSPAAMIAAEVEDGKTKVSMVVTSAS